MLGSKKKEIAALKEALEAREKELELLKNSRSRRVENMVPILPCLYFPGYLINNIGIWVRSLQDDVFWLSALRKKF